MKNDDKIKYQTPGLDELYIPPAVVRGKSGDNEDTGSNNWDTRGEAGTEL